MDKTALITFPYHKTSDGRLFPIIPLKFYSKNRITHTSALIDSGASISIFRSEIAEELGINIEKGKKFYLHGVGGRVKGYIHKLKIEADGKKFICPIVFSHEYLISLNLIGREAFF